MKQLEIIDKVLRFYTEEGGQRGIDDERIPHYYLNENTKCAIGCLVDKPELLEEYSNDTELYTIRNIYQNASSSGKYPNPDVIETIRKIFPDDITNENTSLAFLSYLQRIHDCVDRDKDFVEHLTEQLGLMKERVLKCKVF